MELELRDVVIVTDAVNALRAQINNRLSARQQLWEKIVAMDGEISGLREAQYQIEKLPGHAVALNGSAKVGG